MEEDRDELDPPSNSKQKKFFTAGEIIKRLKEKDHKITEVCRELTDELCPLDLDDKEANDETGELFERLEKVVEALKTKVSRLSKEYKQRKFRHHPEQLNRKEFSCSQYSVLQSDDSESIAGSQESSWDPTFGYEKETKVRSTEYQKNLLILR